MTPDQPPTLRRSQLVALGGAAMLVPLNSTMIAVALPRIAEDFDQTVGATSVLVTVYLVAMLIGQPVAGRVGDRLGRGLTIRAALGVFLTASLAAAAAPSFLVLVVARLGQAAGGALLVPNLQALLRSATPAEDRGRVFGLLGSMLGVGAASGPVVAGGLIQLAGWPAIFLVNVPATAVALFVREPVAVVEDEAEAATVSGRVANPVFVSGFGIQALATMGQYLLLLLAPILLEARGWSAGQIGLALSGLTIGMVVAGPVGGRAGDRRGRRLPVVAGLAAALVAIVAAAGAGDGIDAALLIATLVVFGLGLGFAVPSIMTAALESVSGARAGAAAGVLSMSRYVGSIVSSLIVAAWIADDGGGAQRALVVAAVACGVALVLSARIPGPVGGATSGADGHSSGDVRTGT